MGACILASSQRQFARIGDSSEKTTLAREYEFSSYTVVLLGNFNPQIFSPAWFEKYELLTEDEGASAAVQIIMPEVAQFTAGGFSIFVDRERFSASAVTSAVGIKDLVLKTFGDYLYHTPVHSLGINRDVHFKLPSQEVRMRLGRMLAPLAPWGEWGAEIEKGSGPTEGGMASITMKQVGIADRPKGYLQTTVQPSVKLPRPVGVYFQVNDHYEIEDRENLAGCEEILSLLEANFEHSIERAESIIDAVLKQVDG